MKMLIVGGSGLLGRELLRVLSHSHEVGGTYYAQPFENCKFLDIRDRERVKQFIELYSPDIVIHTAAVKNADFCEENKELAWGINVEGTKNLVEVCKEHNIKFVYISSDYVFDGTEESYNESQKPVPVNFYGITKLEGERAVKEELIDYLIIRPTILYGHGDKHSYVNQVRAKLSQGEVFEADNRVIKYPLLTEDVALLIEQMLANGQRGIFHIGGKDGVTRYEWALQIACIFGLDQSKIKPVEEKYRAARPYHVRLITSSNEKLRITGLEQGLRTVKMRENCTFKLFYSGHPAESALGTSVSLFRIEAGKLLAREAESRVDMVVPIPESGIFYATGFAEEAGLPLRFGIIREEYSKKTLFEPRYEQRTQALQRKLTVISQIIKGKTIALVDEALLSGMTISTVVKKLKEQGVKGIHVRIASPPILYSCPVGEQPRSISLVMPAITPNSVSLTAQSLENKLCQHFGIDSFKFLGLENLKENLLQHVAAKCLYCFDGHGFVGG